MMDDFSIPPQQVAEIADRILDIAQTHGAQQAQVSLSQNQGLSLEMRQGRVQSRKREAHSGFSLTVFHEGRRASVRSTDLRETTLHESVKAACTIAYSTGKDIAACPASTELLCQSPHDLDLFHHWDLDEDQAIVIARRLENGISNAGASVQSDGATVKTNQSYFHLATSEGFNQGVAQSTHTLGCSALARSGTISQLNYWSESARKPADLPAPEWVGQQAAEGAAAYLDQRPLTSRRCAVLFDPRSAVSLLGHFAQAISSQALYTNSSFLLGKINHSVMAEHLHLLEDPFKPAGKASLAFDGDGIAPHKRLLVDGGVLQGYLLSLYGARRLNMAPTGNGFGPSNVRLISDVTVASDDLGSMLRKLNTGLLVTSLAGNGVRIISGDYSRGARGFWVENGVIQYAVVGITISSNLSQMLHGIVALGSDEICQGAFTTGSILVNEMQISGQ